MLMIKQHVVETLMDHSRREVPIEACGYLAEKDGVIVRHYEMTNVDKSAIHFSLEPKEQFESVGKMREAGQKLRAVYHSHPATPARISEEDKKLAVDPDISYVVVSLLDNNIKSFRILNGTVESEEIKVIEQSVS